MTTSERRLRGELLENRRLLAQSPQFIGDGEFCSERGRLGHFLPNEMMYSSGADVAYFSHAYGSACGSNNANPTIWRTDGTEAGTYQLGPGSHGRSDVIYLSAALDHRVYFQTSHIDAPGAGFLYESDGTQNNAVPIARETWSFVFQEDFYYFDWDNDRSTFLRTSTDSGIVTLAEFDSEQRSPSSIPSFPSRVPQSSQFAVFLVDGVLWKTDGTPEGTVEVVEINASGRNGFVWFGEVDGLDAEDRVWFQSSFGGSRQIWVTDGTTEGTMQLPLDTKFVPATESEVKQKLTTGRDDELGVRFDLALLELSDGRLLFEGSNDAQGPGYWVTDGTERGTYKIAEYPLTSEGYTRRDSENDLYDLDVFQVADKVVIETAFDSVSGSERKLFAFDVSAPIDGDLDRNGRVDFSDFLQLAKHFGRQDASAEQGDIDHDDQVAFTDFLILHANFGKSKP